MPPPPRVKLDSSNLHSFPGCPHFHDTGHKYSKKITNITRDKTKRKLLVRCKHAQAAFVNSSSERSCHVTLKIGRIPKLSAFGKRLLRHKQPQQHLHGSDGTPLSGTQKVVLNRKRLRQVHLFTLFLSISIPSNWQSSDVSE